jgi:hypothetical protein
VGKGLRAFTFALDPDRCDRISVQTVSLLPLILARCSDLLQSAIRLKLFVRSIESTSDLDRDRATISFDRTQKIGLEPSLTPLAIRHSSIERSSASVIFDAVNYNIWPTSVSTQ